MSVLVTDASGNHALAVIRSLGQRGIRVVAADSSRFTQGGFSRFCARRALYPSPVRGIREFQAGLLRMIETIRPAVLMPMTERTLTALASVRHEIESRVTLAPLPSRRALEVAFDKQATVDLAASLGVAVPRTIAIRRLSDLERIRSEIPYPAVIKPRRSENVTADGRVVAGGSVEYCFGPESLEEAYLEVHRRAPFPLIQEFIPGEGFGISLLYTLATRGQCPQCFDYRPGVLGRWLAGDLKHLLAVLRGRPEGWTEGYPSRLRSLADFLKFRQKDLHYDDLWRSDPKPFFAGIMGAVFQRVPTPAPRRRLSAPAEASPEPEFHP